MQQTIAGYRRRSNRLDTFDEPAGRLRTPGSLIFHVARVVRR
jgi:hypothetical protein